MSESKVIEVAIPVELHEEVVALCRDADVPLEELVRDALRWWLDLGRAPNNAPRQAPRR